ncbi:MAG: hypothetical protein EPN21_08995 [Methylococcaceae bacterium]|nr:MAG: hypothetical protein EPN21_08995 [Methylococcaceae bacterium]
MTEAMQWVLLELGVLMVLLVSVIAVGQWWRRRAFEQAVRALLRQVKQSESERKRTLTGILTGAHRLAEPQSAELADSLIRSERVFFRYCLEAMLSQDSEVIANLSQDLYGVLDDYLRKCAPFAERSPSPAPFATSAVPAGGISDLDDVFRAAESAMDDATLIVPPPATARTLPPAEAAPPPAEEEIDWDAAFAEQFEESAPAAAPPEPESVPEPVPPEDNSGEDTLYHLLNEEDEALFAAAAKPAEEAAATPAAADEDVMADWGAALEEQAAVPAKPAAEETFDLGWDDAFLEESTVKIKKP